MVSVSSARPPRVSAGLIYTGLIGTGLVGVALAGAASGWVARARRAARSVDELRRALTLQALRDPLTGLPNRQQFTDQLADALAGSARPLVVLQLDLDGFQEVNDASGHGVGDAVLRTVADRLVAVARPGDTVARLGGDEFAILMPGTDLNLARGLADRAVAALAEPMHLDGLDLQPVRTSVGLAAVGPGDQRTQWLLRDADVAMSWAKARGDGAVAVYDRAVHAATSARLELQHDLARAVEEDQLRLHYQPNVDLTSGQVLAFEALVRWQHPRRGLLPPSEFVPDAEDSGLVVPMGSWVLREACRAGAEELSVGDRPPDVAVNISARQVAQPGWVDLVLGTLAETGLDPGRLKLEITESCLLQDRERVVDKLAVLRRTGIWVAVDDFGTGYSSLSYLADLPVDVLKIDKSFVDRICGERGGLVDAIVVLAHSLDLITVAEGVETAEQARRVRDAGCTVAQGYLWSPPVPLADAVRLLGDPLTGRRYLARVDAGHRTASLGLS